MGEQSCERERVEPVFEPVRPPSRRFSGALDMGCKLASESGQRESAPVKAFRSSRVKIISRNPAAELVILVS